MQYSKQHTSLALHCMKHCIKEFIPFAHSIDEYHDVVTFTLKFTVKKPINNSFVPHLEARMAELSNHLTVKEMLEGNARDYLLAQDEKGAARLVNPGGKRLISLLTLYGQYYVIPEELSQELWPTKILLFQEENECWTLVGASRKTKETLLQFAEVYKQIGAKRYPRRGKKNGFFSFSGKGTTWLELGIQEKEHIKKMVRELYKKIGCSEKEYPDKPCKESFTFHFEEQKDDFFPGNRCYRDVGYLPYNEKKIEEIFDLLTSFFSKKGCTVEKNKNHTLLVKDIFGISHIVSNIKKEQWKEGPFARITLFFSLERVCSLLLEKE